MRKIACTLTCLLLSLSARATSFATDASDLWWNANESGWGVNVMQQNTTLFMTFFVYGSNGAPIWYVAPAVTYAGTSGNSLSYSGTLYQTAGPWFGTTFNPANATNRVVGSVTFNLNSVTSASMSYSVDGVTVSKSLTRQTWKAEDYTGTYVGGSLGTNAGCSSNGYGEEVDVFTATQNGTAFSMTATNVQVPTSTCTYTGTYSQDGRMGSVAGTYRCSNGTSGNFNAFEMEVSITGFTARATLRSGSCNWVGRLGGVRRMN